MYGNSVYGLKKYADDKASSGMQDDYYVDLARYVPTFLAEIREMAEIYRVQGYEAGKLQHDIEDIIDQCFVDTATWGLLRWESVYGIITNMSLSYEQRREIVKAKMRGQGTTTKRMIQETAAAFSGGEVNVIEDNAHNHFIVKFIGIKGIPRNMQAFIEMLEDIKPAHLSYEFQYTYTLWGNLKKFTWGGLSGITYGELKIMEGV